MKQIPKRVMIVSFDAVGAKDLEYLQTLPNFQRFFEQAALCSHVNSVCPSLTYPAHTSIVTGRMPKNHGIVNNKKPAQTEGSGLALSSQMDPQHDAL